NQKGWCYRLDKTNDFPHQFPLGRVYQHLQVEGGYNEGGKGVATTDLGARAGITDADVGRGPITTTGKRTWT
ncbi:hypothetical protein ACKVMQ_00480, partial [Faecalibacterium hattorii]